MRLSLSAAERQRQIYDKTTALTFRAESKLLWGFQMDKLVYSLATEKDIPFICKTYNENIDALHGLYRNEDVWQKLLADKDSAYYIVFADAPVAWFRTETEDGALWIGMLQVAPAYQRNGIGKYIISVVEKMAKAQGFNFFQIALKVPRFRGHRDR